MTARIAIVTGTRTEATALRLAGSGLDVAVLARDTGRRTGLVERVTALGRRAAVLDADIGDAAAVDWALGEVGRTLGEPAVLVNLVDAPSGGLADPDWYAPAGARLREVFLLSRAVTDPMIRTMWGRIVTVLTGDHPTIHTGLSGFTRTVAAELGPFGITANLLTVAGDDTDRTAGAALSFLLSDDAGTVSGQVVHIGPA
jgi:3-oxoacyl-[acyl-carrier protein] reductase